MYSIYMISFVANLICTDFGMSLVRNQQTSVPETDAEQQWTRFISLHRNAEKIDGYVVTVCVTSKYDNTFTTIYATILRAFKS